MTPPIHHNPGNDTARPRRLLPQRPLPPYSYVSGKFPHPTREAQGHSYGSAEPNVVISQPEQWRQCEPYLWGIDLFNWGYYWEAHETWEAVWHAANRTGAMAEFCKGLIKLAAAGVKAREGRAGGVKQHAQRAKQLFELVASAPVPTSGSPGRPGGQKQSFMGLWLPTLIQCAQQLADDPDAVIDTRDEPVVAVMPFSLPIEE